MLPVKGRLIAVIDCKFML